MKRVISSHNPFSTKINEKQQWLYTLYFVTLSRYKLGVFFPISFTLPIQSSKSQNPEVLLNFQNYNQILHKKRPIKQRRVT